MGQLVINPQTHQLEGPGVGEALPLEAIRALVPPGCPVCGTPVEVDRVDITWDAADEAAGGRSYMLGRWECPRGCDPVRGVRRHYGQSFERHREVDGTVCRCSCGDETVVTNVGEGAAWQAEHRPPGADASVFQVRG